MIFILHAAALTFQQLTWQSALFDSLIFNAVFSALGLTFWYPAKYLSIEKTSAKTFLLSHIMESVFIALVWLGLSYACIHKLFSITDSYHTFLQSSFIWRLLIGILYYFVITAFYYIFIYSANMNKQMLKEAELKTLVKEAELRSLKFQINPHFIFNSLNSINSLTMTDPAKAGEMTIKLGDFLRYTLKKNDTQTTELGEELKAAKLYLDIEKVRFGDKFEYSQNIKNGCLKQTVPNMILQPLFENAIKHGVYESLGTVLVRFECQLSGSYLHLMVDNTFDPETTVSKGEGIGLQNIRSRLTMMYNQKDLLQVKKENNHFNVNVFIPIDQT
jgi:sensor histidine kinase YesM